MTTPNATTTRTGRSLEQLVDVETPEQVVLSYTVAGVGSRAAAALIDYLICLSIMLALLISGALLSGAFRGRAIGASLATVGSWSLAIYVLVGFAVFWGYHMVYEGLFDGQTPGKRRLGIRVVQDGGYSVGFAASAVRNLTRVLDMQPAGAYAVGLISVAASRSGKRIGDMLAGTIVVRERTHLAPAPGGPQTALANATSYLTDEEFAVLDHYMARRQSLEPERRQAIAAQLATRLAGRMPDASESGPAMLRRLHEHESAVRARGAAARSDTGAAREQHAIVAAGSERWREFAARLTEVQRRGGLRALPEEEITDFVAHYRELTTDLARLTTAARGREIDALFYLSRLVASGHNLLYRQRALVAGAVFEYVARTVPREIRRSARPILLASLLFFGPMAGTFAVLVRSPGVAPDLLPPAMLDRAEQAAKRERTGAGYIDDPEVFRPVFASGIIANNIQVTFAVFAFGVTAGVGTLLMLVVNGVSIGALAGLYQSYGVLELLLKFVAPHGVLELTAIAIAGGAGFLVASAIVMPGSRTRGEALVRQGRRAIRLIAGSTILLLPAGIIEGLISPIPWWPLEWKLFIALVTGLLVVLYLTRGRGAPVDDAVEENAYLDAAPRFVRAPSAT